MTNTTARAQLNHRFTLASQIVSSGRAAAFTVAGVQFLEQADFGRVATVVLVSILLNTILRGAVTNPVAVMSRDRPEVLGGAIATQFGLALFVAAVASVGLAAADLEPTIAWGLLAVPFVAAVDAARVALIHLGRARDAALIDLTWLTFLAAGVFLFVILDGGPLMFLAIWAATAAMSLAPLAVVLFRRGGTAVTQFVIDHRSLGSQMVLEIALESIPTRVVPVVALPIIAIEAPGSFRIAETTLGVAVVLWSASALSSLREASASFDGGGKRGAMHVVQRHMLIVAGAVALNVMLAFAIGSVIGDRLFNDSWDEASRLLLPTGLLLLAQVFMSIPTITERASHQQRNANSIAAVAAILAIPFAGVSITRGDERLLLVLDALAIFLAAVFGFARLRPTHDSKNSQDLPT